jgi:Holliday junction resolvase
MQQAWSLAMSTEAALWQLIKKNVKGHLVRVENTAGSGTPDVHACCGNHETWIELKLAKGNWLHFRASQIAFFAKRVLHQGGAVKVLWRKQDEICVCDARDVMSVLDYAKPNKDGSVQIPIEQISHQKFLKPWVWSDITEKVYL